MLLTSTHRFVGDCVTRTHTRTHPDTPHTHTYWTHRHTYNKRTHHTCTHIHSHTHTERSRLMKSQRTRLLHLPLCSVFRRDIPVPSTTRLQRRCVCERERERPGEQTLFMTTGWSLHNCHPASVAHSRS